MPPQPPLGFTFAGVACGLKKPAALDLALVVSDRSCAAAATFTRNRFPAAPVLYDRALLAENPAGLRAVAINAGIANACTGDAGLADAAAMAAAAESALGFSPRSCAVMSTGVIGPRLPLAKIEEGIAKVKKAIEGDDLEAIKAAQEELTTASHKLAEAMYAKTAQQQPGAGAGPQPGAEAGPGAGAQAGGKKDDDVVDADFEDVKK